jgi:hypothetical protein
VIVHRTGMQASTLTHPVILSLRPLNQESAGCTAIPTTRLLNTERGFCGL